MMKEGLLENIAKGNNTLFNPYVKPRYEQGGEKP